nr:MAG TPA: hypothetical protein [Caudoviricetes sp.]
MKNEKKGYAVGEVFRHTDGKVYQCVEGETCKRCAFSAGEYRCAEVCCGPWSRTIDGRMVVFVEVTKPTEGMLYRAKNGRMYRLAEGSHWDHWCACDDDPERSCAELDMAVFGGLGPRWYWAPTTDYAPASDESPKPVEPPKRHIELAVVKVEGDKVTFKIADQTHRNDEFSQQVNSDEFKSSNGLCLLSHSVPEWFPLASALYCRGEGKVQDLCEITCTAIEFVRISEAVAEYNATDGRGYEKPWPSVGDKYFFVTWTGYIDHYTFDGDAYDQNMQNLGNFFRSEAEAKAALDRVKQALKR